MANFLSCLWSFTGGACFVLFLDGLGIVFVAIGFCLLLFALFCGLISWEYANQIARGDDFCAKCDRQN